jgi:hypothetical protein
MSTVQEIKAAVARLTPQELADLRHWLESAEQQSTTTQSQQWRDRWAELASRAGAAVGRVTWSRGDLYAR